MVDSAVLSIGKIMNSSVDGAPNGTAAFVQDVGVNHRGGNVLVPQQFLHGSDIVSVGKKMRCKAVPEAVATDGFVDAGKGHGLLDRFSHAAFVKVMSSYLPGTWVLAQRFGWKNKLPSPLTTGIWILPGKCTGKIDMAKSPLTIIFVHRTGLFQLHFQGFSGVFRQSRNAVFAALTLADQDLIHGKVDILHPKTQAFHQTETAPV
jgi:hypothetical protein